MRVLSAMQPSGQLHLGNYFGSMLPNLQLSQEAEESLFFIVDLHALTTVRDPEVLRTCCDDAIRDYLAIGFDPEKTTIFFQSHVAAHAELMWILSTMTPMGLLERAVSYKDKVTKGMEASHGLFSYPVLMAADILLYDIDVVPVGQDQKQHVEMTRDIALKFNHAYGETFVVPEPRIQEAVAVVPGTDGQKMSKSYGNTIPLFGDEKKIKKAIMGIVTDSKDVADPKDPDECTVYQIHALFLDEQQQQELADAYRAGGLGYGDAKKMLYETYMDFFGPLREQRAALTDAFVHDVIKSGADRACATASKKIDSVYKAVGLR